MNQIKVFFEPCSPPPSGGYQVLYRAVGSTDYISAGYFFVSPATFYDTVNTAGTCYEGILKTMCGNIAGNPVGWQTCDSGEDSPLTVALLGACVPGNINSQYIVNGASVGDTLIVRASFSGLMQLNIGLFTRADMNISSTDGTSDSVLSACYSDTGMHGFSISVDTTITVGAISPIINLTAFINNSSESNTNVGVTIISQNGTLKSISTVGCRGNSATGGTC